MYYYKYVYKRINQLRMKSNGTLKYLFDWFLHLFYEFSKEDVNWDFMSENFQCLVPILVKQFESDSPIDFSLPTFLDHEAPPFLEEESITIFIPCPTF